MLSNRKTIRRLGGISCYFSLYVGSIERDDRLNPVTHLAYETPTATYDEHFGAVPRQPPRRWGLLDRKRALWYMHGRSRPRTDRPITSTEYGSGVTPESRQEQRQLTEYLCWLSAGGVGVSA